MGSEAVSRAQTMVCEMFERERAVVGEIAALDARRELLVVEGDVLRAGLSTLRTLLGVATPTDAAPPTPPPPAPPEDTKIGRLRAWCVSQPGRFRAADVPVEALGINKNSLWVMLPKLAGKAGPLERVADEPGAVYQKRPARPLTKAPRAQSRRR